MDEREVFFFLIRRNGGPESFNFAVPYLGLRVVEIDGGVGT